MDKKITELNAASGIQSADVSVLVHNGEDLQFSFAQLLQFVASNLNVGAAISFGTVTPQNTVGKNGDLFINISAGQFVQKVSGVWTVSYIIPSSGAGDGTVIYGNGAPVAGTGKNLDTYIDTTAGKFYLKTAGTWSQVFSMLSGPAGAKGEKGDDGSNGTNGNSILHGPANPDNLTDGVNGDFYLKTSTYEIFGPKTAGVWGTGTSIFGPGIVPGGTAGQILRKVDGTNFNTVWTNEQDISGKADITYVDTQDAAITAMINDFAAEVAANYVNITGAQNIDGVKTFNQTIVGTIDNAMQWNGQPADLSAVATGQPGALVGLNTGSGQWESYLPENTFIQNQGDAVQSGVSWTSAALYGGDIVNGPAVIVTPGGMTINGGSGAPAAMLSNMGSLSLQNDGFWGVSAIPGPYNAVVSGSTMFGGRAFAAIPPTEANELVRLGDLSAYAPATGGNNYLQNQSGVAQNSDFWINGSGKVDGSMTVGGVLNVGGAQLNAGDGSMSLFNSNGFAVYDPTNSVRNQFKTQANGDLYFGKTDAGTFPVVKAIDGKLYDYNSGVPRPYALAADLSGGYVPLSRTVAGFALSGDVTLATHSVGTGLAGTAYNGSAARTWFATLSTGVAGGQTVIGGTGAGDNLTIATTTNGTKGKALIGTSAYDEQNNRLGLGTQAPTHALTLGLGSTGFVSYNNAAGLDAGVTNYERVRSVWGGNTYNMISEAAGTGTARTIRLASPTSLFDLEAGAIHYTQYNANPGVVVSRYNGSIASPTQVLSGQQVGGFYLNGYTSAGSLGSNVGAFQFIATENFTGTAQGTKFALAVTPTGSNARVDRLTIENDGATTVNGTLTSGQFKLSSLNTAPASATATGATGDIRVTAGYLYVCVATNTWVRTALATW